MLFRLARRFSIPSTKFFLLLTGASAIFTYLVSPLRDPAYQPMGANGGSLLWWLQGVREDHWVLAAFILAGMLAISLTLDLWRWSQPQRMYFVIGLMHFLIGIGMWLILCYWFFCFLLDQWLID